MVTLTLVPRLTGDKWVDLEWTQLRIIDNLGNRQGHMIEVTVDVRNYQRRVWVDTKALEEVGCKLDGLHLGVYTTTPYPHPLGLVVEVEVETPDGTTHDPTFIPFYYPKGEYV